MTYRICNAAGGRHITEAETVCTWALSASHPECGASVGEETYETPEEARKPLLEKRMLDAIYQHDMAQKNRALAVEAEAELLVLRKAACQKYLAVLVQEDS